MLVTKPHRRSATSPERDRQRPAASGLAARLVAIGALAAACLAGSLPAQAAGWRPSPDERRLDLQLTAPFDLVRPADVVALELFGSSPERLQRLRERGVATLCHVTAGVWENWRPDARAFPQAALGRSPSGWRGQRWLDVRHPGLRPILEKRLDLCRQRGFDGVLLAGLDGHEHGSGFDLKPHQQLEFNRWLAEVAHARGLAAGIVNDLGQAAELARSFDFLVADRCVAEGECTGVRPFLEAGKPVYLVAYTNQARRMDAYCALAAEVGAPLIFKTQYLNGKLHRRCG
jgi:hypothetical protein